MAKPRPPSRDTPSCAPMTSMPPSSSCSPTPSWPAMAPSRSAKPSTWAARSLQGRSLTLRRRRKVRLAQAATQERQDELIEADPLCLRAFHHLSVHGLGDADQDAAVVAGRGAPRPPTRRLRLVRRLQAQVAVHLLRPPTRGA